MAPFTGATVSAWYTSYISDIYGWKHSTIGIFLACLIQSFLNLITMPNVSRKITAENIKSGKILNDQLTLMELLYIDGVKEIAISVSFLKFTRYVLYMWLPMYLSQWFGFSMITSGYLSSSFYIGALLGGPFLGLMVEKTKFE